MSKVLYEDLFRAFFENNIKYVVIGGFAINLHGIPRLTADLDLMISLSPKNLKNAIDTFSKLGYKPRLPLPAESILDPILRKEWQETKNLVAFSFIHSEYPEEIIDVLIHKDNRFEEYYFDRKSIDIMEFTVPIISLNHLKELKEESGRKQDLADLQMIYKLERIKEELALEENKSD